MWVENVAIMNDIIIKESRLVEAGEKGMDAFVDVFFDAINSAVGGELSVGHLQQLNADQITLLAYRYMRDEVMDGGFVQLIHNGYGGFIFMNPFNKAVRAWGMQDLHRIISKCHRLYAKYGTEIEKDCSDDEFMALFERFPEFDTFDDEFVEKEEAFTAAVAHYIDEHIENFAKIEKDE